MIKGKKHASIGQLIAELTFFLTIRGFSIMAKVSGPLFSMDASGKFAGALVFGKWKGRNVARQLVTPANPQSANQETARNAVRVFGAIQRFFNATTTKRSGETVTDKAELAALAPAGQAWNGFLVKAGIGAQSLTYTAAEAAWNALTSGNKTSWDSAAAALVPPITSVAQYAAGGAAATAATAGKVHFIGQYALFVAGAASAAPTATPPTYA